MNWKSGKNLEYNNTSWGQKDVEFPKILPIPLKFKDKNFEIVINQTGVTNTTFPKQEIEKKAWHILKPDQVAGNWSDYRNFISQSFAELSIAKETYVKAKTGWFSCRSACYLAAGVPVICQDTTWSKYIENGCGLYSFEDQSSAESALEKLISNYKKNSEAALEIAHIFFDHTKVLNAMLNKL
jgi:hypothetical protein